MHDQLTLQDDPPVLNGSLGPPPAAVLDIETYWWHLARLRESRSRAEAARHARSMAGAAVRRCAALAGAPGTGDRDSVAWSDLSACLVRLAMALERDFTWTGCDPDDPADGVAHRAWKCLAHTVTRSDFTVAWQPVGEDIKALAAVGADGSPALLREFTAARVAWAAAAVTEAPW